MWQLENGVGVEQRQLWLRVLHWESRVSPWERLWALSLTGKKDTWDSGLTLGSFLLLGFGTRSLHPKLLSVFGYIFQSSLHFPVSLPYPTWAPLVQDCWGPCQLPHRLSGSVGNFGISSASPENWNRTVSPILISTVKSLLTRHRHHKAVPIIGEWFYMGDVLVQGQICLLGTDLSLVFVHLFKLNILRPLTASLCLPSLQRLSDCYPDMSP